MIPPKHRTDIAEAQRTLAQTRRYRRAWRLVRMGMIAILSIFLTLLIVYTGLALSADVGAWYWGYLLLGDAFLAFMLTMVIRYRGAERMFDSEEEKANRQLAAAGFRPVLRDGQVLVAPLNAPDDAAVMVEGA